MCFSAASWASLSASGAVRAAAPYNCFGPGMLIIIAAANLVGLGMAN